MSKLSINVLHSTKKYTSAIKFFNIFYDLPFFSSGTYFNIS